MSRPSMIRFMVLRSKTGVDLHPINDSEDEYISSFKPDYDEIQRTGININDPSVKYVMVIFTNSEDDSPQSRTWVVHRPDNNSRSTRPLHKCGVGGGIKVGHGYGGFVN